MKPLAGLAFVVAVALAACSSDDKDDTGDAPDGGGGPTDGGDGHFDACNCGAPPDAAPSPFAAVCTPEIEFVNLSAAGNGQLFDQHVPDPVAFAQAHALKVCEVLYREPSEVPTVAKIKLVIEDMDGVAYAGGNEVHFSSTYMKSYSDGGGNLAYEISGVIVHEFTHVYQQGDGPGFLIEGIADFVRFRAGFIPLSNRGPGGNWDDAYQTTAFFLAWLDDQLADFGYKLNQSLDEDDAEAWSEQVFVDLAGKDVDTLWQEYQQSL